MSPYDGLSFSEKLKALRNSDPNFARSVARLRGAAIFLLLATALAAAAAANIVNVGQGNDIRNVHNDVTRIQKTPCGRHPANPSKRCEALRQALAASESIVAECIAHQRVEGTRGRNCPTVYVDLRRGGAPEPSSEGGDALQPGSTGHQQPGPRGGGGGVGDGAGKGGSGQAPAPGQGGSGTPPAPGEGGSGDGSAPPPGGTGAEQSRESAPPPASAAAETDSHPLPETVEAAGGAVEDAGDAAQGVVEGTGKAAGCVVRGSC